jgi:hypothetical protein
LKNGGIHFNKKLNKAGLKALIAQNSAKSPHRAQRSAKDRKESTNKLQDPEHSIETTAFRSEIDGCKKLILEESKKQAIILQQVRFYASQPFRSC